MDPVTDFLAGRHFAVAGASQDRAKFGNRVLRALCASGREVVPIHPRAEVIEGLSVVRHPGELPDGIHGLSIVTPPAVTESVVDAAIARGVPRLWMQPGAEHAASIDRARDAGLTVLHGGVCILVELQRFRSQG